MGCRAAKRGGLPLLLSAAAPRVSTRRGLLLDYGFRAVISTQIADIFRNNSLKNGLVPVVVDESTSNWLVEHPGVEVTLDLEATTLTLPTGTRVQFPIEPFSRYCLLNGIDELGFLLGRLRESTASEADPCPVRLVAVET